MKYILATAFVLASIGWVARVYTQYQESRKKSQYNDPHDVFYH